MKTQMNEIIKLTNGQPVVDSLTIADGAQIEHASVMKLTRKYEDDLGRLQLLRKGWI